MTFFEETNPEIPKYGTSESENDNPAEWIVNLTTQVQAALNQPTDLNLSQKILHDSNFLSHAD